MFAFFIATEVSRNSVTSSVRLYVDESTSLSDPNLYLAVTEMVRLKVCVFILISYRL